MLHSHLVFAVQFVCTY